MTRMAARSTSTATWARASGLAARRRRGAARPRHQRQRGLRVPRRRPRRPCCAPAARPPSAAWRSARRSATATWPGFGRRFVDVAPDDLTADVLYQLGALTAFARVAGSGSPTSSRTAPSTTRSSTTRSRRRRSSRAVAALRPGPAGARPARVGAGSAGRRAPGCRPCSEAFADRAYTADGTLVPRRAARRGAARPGRDRRAAASRWPRGEPVDRRSTAARVACGADSICVHGDTPGAVAIARAVRAALRRPA